MKENKSLLNKPTQVTQLTNSNLSSESPGEKQWKVGCPLNEWSDWYTCLPPFNRSVTQYHKNKFEVWGSNSLLDGKTSLFFLITGVFDSVTSTLTFYHWY